MKLKSLLTAILAGLSLSIAASPALAQSSVTLSGLIDIWTGTRKFSGDKSNAVLNSNGMTTSWFGLTGTEDLGNGLKAGFALTGFFRPDTGESGRFGGAGIDPLFSRDANVFLSGNFGVVTVGRGLAPNFLPSILFNPFGGSFGFAPLILHYNVPGGSGWSYPLQGDTGWSNEIVYTTPTWMGLTANLHYQFGENPGKKTKKNMGLNVLYEYGALGLSAFYENVRVNNPFDAGGTTAVVYPAAPAAVRQSIWFVGASYDFQIVKFYGTYSEITHDVDAKDRTWQLGTSVPVGAGKILASWAHTQRSGDAIPIALKGSRDTGTLGYDYFLSKRTDIYANVMYDDNSYSSSGTSYGVGVRHRF